MAKGNYESKLKQSVNNYVSNADAPKDEIKTASTSGNEDNQAETKKTASKTKNKDAKMKVASFHLTLEVIEAIRLLAFTRRKKVYEVVQELLIESIPDDVLEQAIENVKELEDR